jgi:hypothetical protein
MENVLFEQKKIKLWSKPHFVVENKTDSATSVENAVNILDTWIYKINF